MKEREDGAYNDGRNERRKKTVIGDTIKKRRKELELTQAQLAERMDVSFQAVSKWENNTSIPDATLLPKLARVLGISLDELMEGTERVDGGHKKKQFYGAVWGFVEEDIHADVGQVVGGVKGDIYGDVRGNILGTVGNVYGNIKGSVRGTVNGTVYGDIEGSVWGIINGDVEGCIRGSVWGTVTGRIKGGVMGKVAGPIGGFGEK